MDIVKRLFSHNRSASGEDPPITGSPAADTFNNNMAKTIISSLFFERPLLQEMGIHKCYSFTWLVCTSERFSTSYDFLLKISGGCQETANYCQEKIHEEDRKVSRSQTDSREISSFISLAFWYLLVPDVAFIQSAGCSSIFCSDNSQVAAKVEQSASQTRQPLRPLIQCSIHF